MAVVVGTLYATGLYLMLGRDLVKVALGLGLLSHAANLLIFVAAGLTRGRPPLIGSVSDSLPVADPLPQALILTAIVISFGVFAFVLTLVRRAIEMSGSDDPDALTQERR